MRISAFALCLTMVPVTALANDSMAELKTGGLQYVRTDVVRMVSEDLFISEEKVTVDYVFENTSDADVESLVAFPMPTLIPSAYEPRDVPVPDTNFLGFKVSVEGQPLTPKLEQRATVFGVDVTDDLLDARVPLVPVIQQTYDDVEALPDAVITDWLARGIVTAEEWDVGDGMKMHPFPAWTLDQTYYWSMVFPAGQQVHVSHEYRPSVGGSAGIAFIDWEGNKTEFFDDYVEKYCLDDSIANAVKKRVKPEGGIPLTETWISYILKTANNWWGPIESFRLRIDKGSTDNLVSFCANGVKKIAPTVFEVNYTDYYPDRDLDILILHPSNW